MTRSRSVGGIFLAQSRITMSDHAARDTKLYRGSDNGEIRKFHLLANVAWKGWNLFAGVWTILANTSYINQDLVSSCKAQFYWILVWVHFRASPRCPVSGDYSNNPEEAKSYRSNKSIFGMCKPVFDSHYWCESKSECINNEQRNRKTIQLKNFAELSDWQSGNIQTDLAFFSRVEIIGKTWTKMINWVL